MDSVGETDWHQVFDEICARRGASANAELAQQLCARKGRNGERDFQAALRNINNWRNGTNLPQKANLRLLTELLDIEADQELLVRWRSAYQAARSRRSHLDGAGAERGRSRIWHDARKLMPKLASTAVAVTVLSAAMAGIMVLTGLVPPTGPQADGGDVEVTRTIGYRPYTELEVGQSAIIQARRGPCGEQPPLWHHIEHELPLLLFGRFEDAGLGQSISDTCRGLTPGRLVRYVATKPGTEVFDLFQRTLKVVVRPAGGEGT